jgi:SH3-like domain-containing protein
MTKEDATDLIQRAVKEAIDAADRSKAKGADQDPIQRLDDWKKVNDKNTAKCWEIDSSVFSVGLTVSIIFVPDGSVRTVQIRKSDNTLSEAVALVLDEYKNQTLSNN